MSTIEEDAQLAQDTVDLTALKAKAKEAMDLEDEIATRLEVVQDRKEKLTDILENQLPKLMGTAGMSEFRMDTGELVKCGEHVFASLPNADKNPEGFAAGVKYLDTHGAASLCKRFITVELAREKKGKANELLKMVRKNFPEADVSVKVTVHHGTLTSWVKEKLEAGKDIPLDVLGGIRKMVAKIKRPKTVQQGGTNR